MSAARAPRRENKLPYASFGSCDAILSRSLVRDGTFASLWRRDQGRSTSVLPVLALLASGHGVAGASAWRANVARWTGVAGRDLSAARRTLSDQRLIAFQRTGQRGLWKFAASNQLSTPRRLGFRFRGIWVASGEWQTLSCEARHMLLCLAALALGRVWVGEWPKAAGDEELMDGVLEWLEAMDDSLFSEDLCDGGMEIRSARRVGVAYLQTLAELTGMSAETCIRLLNELSSAKHRFIRWAFPAGEDVLVYCVLDQTQRRTVIRSPIGSQDQTA